MSEYEIIGHRGRCYCRTKPDTRAFEVLINGQWIALGPLQEIERLRAENEKLRKWKEEDGAAMRVFERYRELEAENEKLRAELDALKKFEREKWTGWAAALKEDGDE